MFFAKVRARSPETNYQQYMLLMKKAFWYQYNGTKMLRFNKNQINLKTVLLQDLYPFPLKY